MNLDYSLKQDGFVILKNIFSAEELQPAKNIVEEILQHSRENISDPFDQFYARHRTDQGALFDLFQRHPEFQDLAKNTSVLDALEKPLGPDIFLYENNLVYKPRNTQNFVPWHQDFVNRPHEPKKYIVWIALDDVTRENGAMKVLPGSHKLGFLPCYTVPGETFHTRVHMDDIDVSAAVFAEIKSGDVLIFDQLLLHSSERVDVNIPRRAYRISCQGFEQICVPRGMPIVLRGGKPSSIVSKYQNQANCRPAVQKKNILRRISHKAGRVLLSL